MEIYSIRLGPVFAATLLSILYLAGCGAPAQGSQEIPVRRYEMRGEILRLDPEHHLATIRGEKIEGWMEAMTMEYPVKDIAEFQTLREGDRIIATVFVRGTDYWIGEIRHRPKKGSTGSRLSP
jgi:protein SCO1/2